MTSETCPGHGCERETCGPASCSCPPCYCPRRERRDALLARAREISADLKALRGRVITARRRPPAEALPLFTDDPASPYDPGGNHA